MRPIFVDAIYAAVLALGCLGGCGGGESSPSSLPYATEVMDFTPGPGAGFGQAELPDVVLGPPSVDSAPLAGSLDVLSLGRRGTVVLGFSPKEIVDGAGPDFVVFENVFYANGDPSLPFVELGEVSVSDDGEDWHTFGCAPDGDGQGAFPGCAGWRAPMPYDVSADLLDASLMGGDAFDLAELGLSRVRFVRIADVEGLGGPPSAGFDLDAVGVIHF